MASRWGNSGNRDRLCLPGLHYHCGQWQQPEIERRLLLGGKADLDSILKSRRVTLAPKVSVVKALMFPVVT